MDSPADDSAPDFQRNLKIVLEYDGTNFCGWQTQPGVRTVQDTLERAIEAVTGERVRVAGAGRTDTGVHAEGQVASFRTCSMIPAAKWPLALTSQMPDDAAVLSCAEVPPTFHARHSAAGRIYRYEILISRVRRPCRRLHAWHIRAPLDIDAMRDAAQHLIGEHDFRSFAAELEPGEVAIRRVDRIDVEGRGDQIIMTFQGSGFLRRMVRLVVGTLVEVGQGKRAPSRIAGILEAKDVRKAGPAAPAMGLTLQEVLY
jgi:tRNA pseudouridine38-40 synthase